MNPEAVEWLENLTSDEHATLFTPVVFNATPEHLFNFRPVICDSACNACNAARSHGTLVVVG